MNVRWPAAGGKVGTFALNRYGKKSQFLFRAGSPSMFRDILKIHWPMAYTIGPARTVHGPYLGSFADSTPPAAKPALTTAHNGPRRLGRSPAYWSRIYLPLPLRV